MSKKPLCDCNQGRLPSTCNPQRIAVLENAYIRAGEREHDLRKQLHQAKQQLAERDALLRKWLDGKSNVSELVAGCEAALSASAEPAEVVVSGMGVLTFMRSEGRNAESCVCCPGAHVFCRHFKGLPSFNDMTEKARHRNDLEGRTFRVTVEVLPARAALDKATEGASHE